MLCVLGSSVGQALLFIQSKTNEKQSLVFISKLLIIAYQYFLSLSLKEGGWILNGCGQKIGLLNPRVYHQVWQKQDEKNGEQQNKVAAD